MAGWWAKKKHPFYLIIVDAYSRFNHILGPNNKSYNLLFTLLNSMWAIATSSPLHITMCILTESDLMQESNLRPSTKKDLINLSLAVPQKQSLNPFAKGTWRTVSNMSHSILVQTYLINIKGFHVIMYATFF
jgi:hypothetical protein